MGIYDRDYYREQKAGFTVRGPSTIVGTLILINLVIFVVDGLLKGEAPRDQLGPLAGTMALKMESLTKPWLWWQFLTYGFAHASWPNLWHVVGNMLGLFFLGRDIELTYGRKEFVRLYLVLLVVGSVAWAVTNSLRGVQYASVVGASGAVVGIVVLYAFNFPRRVLLLWGVLPIPAWLLGVLVVVIDLFGAAGVVSAPAGPDGKHAVAYGVHLAGAAFAFLYYQFRWNIGRWTAAWPSLGSLKRQPKLRVHDPDPPERPENDLGNEVDRILKKIHNEGEASLTRKERRTLENASRRYQEKRDDPPNGA